MIGAGATKVQGHASRGQDVRGGLFDLPLGGAGAVQHRARHLRRPRRAHARCTGAAVRAGRRPAARVELRRDPGGGQPLRQCAGRLRRGAGHHRRHPSAAMPGKPDRARRHPEARRHRAADVQPVRAGRHRLSPGRQRRARADLDARCAGAQCRGAARHRHAPACRQRRRRGSCKRAGFLAARRARVTARRDRRHRPGRSGAADLHLGDHRQPEGRAACRPRAARPPAGRDHAARFLPAAGRPLLDAGRLGLGRRTARRAVAVALPRRAGGGLGARPSSIPSGRSPSWRGTASATSSCRRRPCA